MTKPGKIAVAAAAVIMWMWAISVRNGIAYVLLYSMAGAATGIVVGTTARAFASSKVTKASTITGGILGFLILTPILAMLLTGGGSTGPFVILLLSAASLAAIAGAVWGVLDRMTEAYTEWRTGPRGLIPGGAHR